MKIAFYAPMKPPDAPHPSGDRMIASLLIKALEIGGHDVDVGSTLRTWEGAGDKAAQTALQVEAHDEVARILRESEPADLWFTYHVHYKAPDMIGPAVSRAWTCPYVIAEGSYSPKRADGPWATFHRETVKALETADCHLVMSDRDRSGIEAIAKSDAAILDLPAFVDTAPFETLDTPRTTEPVCLLTIAMMREGEKTWSYRFLIDALAHLETTAGLPAWQWHVVGDGANRAEIQDLARRKLKQPIHWHGAIQASALQARLENAHIFVWPGLGEGIGMVYLEAMAAGRPVLAVDGPGVASVVAPPNGGWLTPGSPKAYAERLAVLVRNRTLREQIGAAGRHHVAENHSLAVTARRLDRLLKRLKEKAS